MTLQGATPNSAQAAGLDALVNDPVLSRVRRVRPPLGERLGLIIGLVVLGVIVLTALLAPLLPLADPLVQDLAKINLAPGVDPAHILGTDQLGRDILSRVIYGGRVPLLIGVLSVALSGVIGTVFGMIAGYFGGAVDSVLSRLADAQLALPVILIAIVMLTFAGSNITNLIIVIALGGWPTFFRVSRSQTLAVRNQQFVKAAITAGAKWPRIIGTHVLSSIRGLVIVTATLDFSRALLIASGLTYLGLGVNPPTPDWGLMVSEGQNYLPTAWWVATIPGIAVVITVFAANLVGDALVDRARK